MRLDNRMPAGLNDKVKAVVNNRLNPTANARGVSEAEAQKMMARSKIARVAALLGDGQEAQKALDFFDASMENGADGGNE